MELAAVPCGVTLPACCWVPVRGPAGEAPANWKLEGVKAAVPRGVVVVTGVVPVPPLAPTNPLAEEV